MNGRLKIIEQQLLGIDSAAFQNLCDIYLALRRQVAREYQQNKEAN